MISRDTCNRTILLGIVLCACAIRVGGALPFDGHSYLGSQAGFILILAWSYFTASCIFAVLNRFYPSFPTIEP